MPRGLQSAVLASFGLILFIQALLMPLFEWEVNIININLSPAYHVYVDSFWVDESGDSPAYYVYVGSLWTAELGDSIEDSDYIRKNTSVSIDEKICSDEGGLKIVVERSSRDKALDLMSIIVKRIVLWLVFGALLVILLSGLYGAWMEDGQEDRTIRGISISIVTIAISCCFLVAIGRVLGPRNPGVFRIFEVSHDCYGTLTLSAELSKIYSGTLMMASLGILSELGALGIALRRVILAVHQEKESPKPPVD